MKIKVSQNTADTIRANDISTDVRTIDELLGDSDEFALLRETLWIYSQIVDGAV
jgi:hypothetical protein